MLKILILKLVVNQMWFFSKEKFLKEFPLLDPYWCNECDGKAVDKYGRVMGTQYEVDLDWCIEVN